LFGILIAIEKTPQIWYNYGKDFRKALVYYEK